MIIIGYLRQLSSKSKNEKKNAYSLLSPTIVKIKKWKKNAYSSATFAYYRQNQKMKKNAYPSATFAYYRQNQKIKKNAYLSATFANYRQNQKMKKKMHIYRLLSPTISSKSKNEKKCIFIGYFRLLPPTIVYYRPVETLKRTKWKKLFITFNFHNVFIWIQKLKVTKFYSLQKRFVMFFQNKETQ